MKALRKLICCCGCSGSKDVYELAREEHHLPTDHQRVEDDEHLLHQKLDVPAATNRQGLEASVYPPEIARQLGRVHSVNGGPFEPPLSSTRREDAYYSDGTQVEPTTDRKDSTFSKTFWSDIRRWGNNVTYNIPHERVNEDTENKHSAQKRDLPSDDDPDTRVPVDNCHVQSVLQELSQELSFIKEEDNNISAKEEDDPSESHGEVYIVSDNMEADVENMASSAPAVLQSFFEDLDSTLWSSALSNMDPRHHSTPKSGRSPQQNSALECDKHQSLHVHFENEDESTSGSFTTATCESPDTRDNTGTLAA